MKKSFIHEPFIYLCMSKTKSGFILFVFFFSTLLFQFCKKEDKGTFKTYIHKCYFAEINTTTVGGYYTIYSARDTLKVDLKDTNGFIIITEDTTIRMSQTKANGSLYATSPVLPPTISQDSLIILTLNNFDASHPAGSDVSDCFLVSHVFSSAFNFLPLEQFSEVGKNSYSQDFKLHLIKHPSSNELRLRLYFYDKVYTDGIMVQSPTILFKP
jgi:hypothetical protein